MANSRRPNSLLWLTAAAALLSLSARAQVAVSRAVLGAGGGVASGGVYAITDTIGESPVGVAAADVDTATGGFWGTFGSLPEPPSLSLTVRSNGLLTIATSPLLAASYDDGEPLAVTSVDAVSAAGGSVVLLNSAISYKAPTNYAGADSFHYTISDDEGDAATGLISIDVVASMITVTSAADSGPGTLRAAIDAFNAVGVPGLPLQIKFAPSLSGQTILLSNVADSSFGPSALVVSNTQNIDGSDAPGLAVAVASSASPMRLLFVPAGAQVTVANLILTNGEALGGTGGTGGGGGGGAAGFGGGILNEGTLTLSSVILSSNQAVGGMGGAGAVGAPGSPGAPSYGGFGAGTGGSGTCGGNGGMGAGGALFNYGGVANLTNCIFRHNSATEGASGAGLNGCDGVSGGPSLGGGVFNYNGYVYLTDCVLTNNNAAIGGGLCNYGDAAASWVYLTGNNLANNSSTNDFAALSANGGDAQTVEGTNNIATQDALWFSPIPDVGVFQTNVPISVPIALNIPTNISTPFVLQALSSQPSLVAPGGFVFTGGSGGNYTLTITPSANQLGTTLVTVFTEGAGLSAQTSFIANFGLFLTVTITPGGRILNVTSDPGLTCTIQYKDTLSAATWTTLGNMAQTSPGHYQILDSSAQGPERFYRAVIP